MNPRIEELYREAEKSTAFLSNSPRSKELIIRNHFAELIVRECISIVIHSGYESEGPFGPKRNCTPPEIAKKIHNYFNL